MCGGPGGPIRAGSFFGGVEFKLWAVFKVWDGRSSRARGGPRVVMDRKLSRSACSARADKGEQGGWGFLLYSYNVGVTTYVHIHTYV